MSGGGSDRGPVPPDELVIRVGVSPDQWRTPTERLDVFRSIGRHAYDDVVSALPEGWSWSGKRALDFGCGSGRMLRWFHPHLDDGLELAACDIHVPTIEWLRGAFPDVNVFANDEDPPLDLPAGSFDLIFSGSVFSHLRDWAPWVLELRRLLKPGGYLVASIHSVGFWPSSAAARRGEGWDEDATGLLVEGAGDSFDDGLWGPSVYASEWWFRAHWGRALEILRWEPTGFALPPEQRDIGQAWFVARRPVGVEAPGVDDLLAPADDPRELRAALRAQRLAYDEVDEKHAVAVSFWSQIEELSAVHEQFARVQGELERVRARNAQLEAPRSDLSRIARAVRRRLAR